MYVCDELVMFKLAFVRIELYFLIIILKIQWFLRFPSYWKDFNFFFIELTFRPATNSNKRKFVKCEI